MADENLPLLEQLYDADRALASYAFVIGQTARERLKATAMHDFIHSEAVLGRLSQILVDARQFGLNPTEIFLLVASAYLHDIGRAEAKSGARHGDLSADMIATDEKLMILFPAADFRSQVERVCDYHDREIAEIQVLDKEVRLDTRPQSHINLGERVRLRMLTAIFRLADELECISDRLRGVHEKAGDPRSKILAIRIDLEARFICMDFSRDADEEERKGCTQYLTDILVKLDPFLKDNALSFKVVDKLPEVSREPEEEEEDQNLFEVEDIAELEEKQETISYTRQGDDLKAILISLEKNRMNRVRSVISLVSKEGG